MTSKHLLKRAWNLFDLAISALKNKNQSGAELYLKCGKSVAEEANNAAARANATMGEFIPIKQLQDVFEEMLKDLPQ